MRLHSEKGQALVETAFMIPLLLLLSLGVIEFANAIDSYMVLGELTRQGASMTSRGTPADIDGPDNDVLDFIIEAAGPVIDPAEPGRWRIFYSRIGPSNDADNPNACADTGEPYIVLERSERGGLGQTSQLGALCATANLPDIGSVGAGQELYAIEVYYQYATITGFDYFGIDLASTPIYVRAVF